MDRWGKNCQRIVKEYTYPVCHRRPTVHRSIKHQRTILSVVPIIVVIEMYTRLYRCYLINFYIHFHMHEKKKKKTGTVSWVLQDSCTRDVKFTTIYVVLTGDFVNILKMFVVETYPGEERRLNVLIWCLLSDTTDILLLP